jgi:hypothetical protein
MLCGNQAQLRFLYGVKTPVDPTERIYYANLKSLRNSLFRIATCGLFHAVRFEVHQRYLGCKNEVLRYGRGINE